MRADRARLEQASPALRGLLPGSLDFYAFDQGLVVTAADARRVRVTAPDFAVSPYAPASEEAFGRVSFMSQRWNGGYNTRDFVVRHVAAGGRWIGLFTDKEAADAADDGRLVLSRLDRDYRERWRAPLPIAELRNRWEWPHRLLLAGTVPVAHRGATETHEVLVAVSLSDGAVRAWNLTRERDALAP